MAFLRYRIRGAYRLSGGRRKSSRPQTQQRIVLFESSMRERDIRDFYSPVLSYTGEEVPTSSTIA